MNNTEKTLEKHTKEVIIEQIDICLSGQDPRYQLGRYIEKLKEEIIQQALAEERDRVVKLVTKDIQSAPHCNSSHSDLLSSLDKPLTDKE